MPDEPEPPRKFYGLKTPTFDRLNAPPREANAPEPEAAASTGPAPVAEGRIDVRDLTRIAGTPGPVLSSPVPGKPNDVHQVLAGNLAAANAAGLNDVAPRPKRRSRRKRDYILLMITVNAFFAFWAFGPYANAMTFVYGLAGIVLFSISLSWVMFGVMDDY